MTYSDNRLDTITTLLANIDSEPHLTRQGVLTGRPSSPVVSDAAVVHDLTGKISTMSNSMSNKEFHNAVVVRSSGAGGNQIVGYAEISTGPLSVRGPLGPRILTMSSPLDKTTNDANRTAKTRLDNISKARAKQVKLDILPHPGVDLGDVVRATDPQTGRVEIGVIDDFVYSLEPSDLMSVVMTIPNEVIPWA